MANALFKGATHAQLYNSYRYQYPATVYDKILTFLGAKLSPPFNLALDVGCGSGQGIRPLAHHFKQVIATDVSENQIVQARQNNSSPNIRFEVGIAEKLQADNNSVDLVTAFTAVHWFNIPKFVEEVSRVLKPAGCLVLCGYERSTYDFPHCTAEQELSRVIRMYKLGWSKAFPGDVLQKYQRRTNHYTDIEIPEYNEVLYDDSMRIVQTMSVSDLLNTISTSSAYQYYKQARPDGEMTIDALRTDISEILSIPIGEVDLAMLTVEFPVFLKMFRKPEETF